MNPLLSPRNRDRLFGLLLLAVTMAAYSPALNGGLLWDDHGHITKPELRSVKGLARIWAEPGAAQQYYPLVHTVFWLEHRLWGEATTGYHVVNVFLHVVSALLLLVILRRLQIPGAWLAASLFALHPVQVESVAWITELKNTLSGVFFFGTALAYLRFDGSRKKGHYALAACLFMPGLLSKSVVAILPAALLAAVWWKRGALLWKRDVVPLLPLFLLGILSGLFTVWAERTFIIGGREGEFDFSVLERCLIAGRVFWFYLGTLVWPADLMFIYPRWDVDAAVWWQHLFPAAALALVVALWALRNRSRAPFAALACYAAALFPVMGFFNVYPFRFSFVADHFQYLACVAPLALAAAAIGSAFVRAEGGAGRILRPVFFCVLPAMLAVLTWRQSGQYRDAETLYRATVRKNPSCWMAHNNLGILLAEKGQSGEAEFHYRQALAINPALAEGANNLGVLLMKDGRREEAEAAFQKALAVNPRYARARYNLGGLLAAAGRRAEAAAQLRQAVETGPSEAQALNRKEYADAWFMLGNALLEGGRTDEAAACYRRALEAAPGRVDARYNLGNALLRSGRAEEAVSCYLRVVAVSPGSTDALNNLALAFLHLGRCAEAEEYLAKALAAAGAAGQEARAAIIRRDLEKLRKECRHDGP